ncbi:MAG UNVERIFIED_CONTAM: hypothetical protein LVR18_26245 [Planctomycetaceae bacterium]
MKYSSHNSVRSHRVSLLLVLVLVPLTVLCIQLQLAAQQPSPGGQQASPVSSLPTADILESLEREQSALRTSLAGLSSRRELQSAQGEALLADARSSSKKPPRGCSVFVNFPSPTRSNNCKRCSRKVAGGLNSCRRGNQTGIFVRAQQSVVMSVPLTAVCSPML